MIFITGDLHGEIDVGKLNSKGKFHKKYKNLTKSDYLIICGDFGFIWDGSKTDRWWLKWLDKKPYTVLFIDGNHENHDLLDSYPVSEWNGGKIHRIMPNVLHLMRGQVFTIDGLRFFTMGGAHSHDIEIRVEGKSWWRREMPSEAEFQTARDNLAAYGWEVDYVISHSIPGWLLREVFPPHMYGEDALTDFFSEISEKLIFKKWFSGHYHIDGVSRAYPKFRLIYQDVIPL